MPPKVKCAALAVDAMATQETQADVPDEQVTPAGVALVPEETPAPTESPAPPEAPPKRGRPKLKKNGTKHVRATMASVLAMEISDDLEIHSFVVQRVLDSLEKTAVHALKERGVFRMAFMTARIRTRLAQKETDKRICGRDVTLKAKPARHILKLTPTKYLRQKFM